MLPHCLICLGEDGNLDLHVKISQFFKMLANNLNPNWKIFFNTSVFARSILFVCLFVLECQFATFASREFFSAEDLREESASLTTI